MTLRPVAERGCTYDLVSLGEVMLRLDPGESRIRAARRFDVWEGGGEYNVARGLSRCFGMRTAVVTRLVDNEIGRLLESLIAAGGVDGSNIAWAPFDGIGYESRNALNFTERGFGVRGAIGVSDRAHSASGQMRPGDVDWDRIFGEIGVRWFHTGGIFAALSESAAQVAEEAMRSAQKHGVTVSFDLNYRPSLWSRHGGQAAAQQVNTHLAKHVDVMIGNEEDYSAALGIELDVDSSFADLNTASFESMIRRAVERFPNLRVAATTLRSVKTATRNDWSAVGWSRDEGFLVSQRRQDLEILDRVGGGDSFVSGLVYGLLTGRSLADALEYGAAHGALAMTTPGDTSQAALAEVERLVVGASARIQR